MSQRPDSQKRSRASVDAQVRKLRLSRHMRAACASRQQDQECSRQGTSPPSMVSDQTRPVVDAWRQRRTIELMCIELPAKTLVKRIDALRSQLRLQMLAARMTRGDEQFYKCYCMSVFARLVSCCISDDHRRGV